MTDDSSSTTQSFLRPDEGGVGKGYLVVLRGAVVGQTYEIHSRTVIGRSSECDLRIYDDSLSRQHVAITPPEDDTGDFVIEDLDSRNGTWVNGDRITKQPLRDGDRIAIGRALWKFSLQDELEKQLLAAQRMEAIGSLAAGVAHDFNNLLLVVQGGVSLLQAMLSDTPAGISQEVAATLEDITAAADRGAGLTRQLLTFARGGSVTQQRVDVSTLLTECARLSSRTFDRNIEIEVAVQPSLYVMGDESQLQQMLMNLCINSRDAMPKGGSLMVGAERVELSADDIAELGADFLPGDHLRLRIADTGHGMDEETRRRAFEPFASTKGVGRGLGLAMVRTIVRGHGGAIVLHSRPDEGSRFDIYLPALTGGGTQPRRERKRTEPTRQGTLLVVDDDAAVRRATGVLARQLGYDVVAAADGAEALRVFVEHRENITVVLLDLVMPQMNGAATFAELRAIDPEVKVLLCSGYDDGQASDIMAEHDVVFLQKPYSAAALAEAIDQTLS